MVFPYRTRALGLPFATRKQTGGCGPSARPRGPDRKREARCQDAARLARRGRGGEDSDTPRVSGDGEFVGLRRGTRGHEGGSLGGQPQMGEDLGHDRPIFDGGEEAEAPATAGTREDVDGEGSSFILHLLQWT